MSHSTSDKDFRLLALRLRRELEEYSTELWSEATSVATASVWVTQVSARLHLLVGRVATESSQEALAVVRAAVIVYRETSDVLHGRMRGSHVADLRMDEWREAVEAYRGCLRDMRAGADR